jgi:tetratricopeptide (TPR) repeat protein
LLRGAEDEFLVHTRVAQINQQRNQPAAALTSYIAANALKPGNRNVALGIVALTDAVSHRDAVAWAARGSALMTLNRGADALAALKQAQSLAPSMPDLRAQIAQAEKLARSQGRARDAGADAVRVAQSAPPAAPARRYSNSAEASRSN